MKRIFLLLAFFMSWTVLPSYGQTVTVSWFEPDKYTDIDGANETRKRFRGRVFDKLEEHFNELAEKLPQGTTLEIKVVNVNLAGDVRYNFALGQEIRLIKHIYWPTLEFEYKLKSGANVLLQDTVKVSDSSFMDRIIRRSRNEFLSYEKQMLTRWFKKELVEQAQQAWQQHNAVM